MTFVISWTIDSANRNAANERFKQTGAPPPEGVKMLSRWHSIAGGEGLLVCESDDPVALGKWMQQWSDLLEFRIMPVVSDEGIAQVIS